MGTPHSSSCQPPSATSTGGQEFPVQRSQEGGKMLCGGMRGRRSPLQLGKGVSTAAFSSQPQDTEEGRLWS